MLLFEPGKVEDLAGQILLAYQQAEYVQGHVARGVAVYRKHLWKEQKRHLIDCVAGLLPRPPVAVRSGSEMDFPRASKAQAGPVGK
jgi:hypothetical protein